MVPELVTPHALAAEVQALPLLGLQLGVVIVTVVDFDAFGPTPLLQVRVNVVVFKRTPEDALPLPFASMETAPIPLSMEQVTVPPPVTPVQLRVVLEPLRTLEAVELKEPMATFARQILPFQVLPAAQLAVTVCVARTVPLPFVRLNIVWGYAT